MSLKHNTALDIDSDTTAYSVAITTSPVSDSQMVFVPPPPRAGSFPRDEESLGSHKERGWRPHPHSQEENWTVYITSWNSLPFYGSNGCHLGRDPSCQQNS
ncbi:hypothetical protein J6590_021027 [Homalodisca vitripennis]|nr:hypothetical protein J6590_021027 [Homalodisca vitripennis]